MDTPEERTLAQRIAHPLAALTGLVTDLATQTHTDQAAESLGLISDGLEAVMEEVLRELGAAPSTIGDLIDDQAHDPCPDPP